jgi:RNA polymerase sigma factor (sigma-70 family)
VEASALTHASRSGFFTRPSPLLKLQDDEDLVKLTRSGNPAAFEALVSRYQSRLLGFCRQMLGSTEDAEDVLQEVFVAAYNAMVADDRPLAVRPWLYRICRNRCLNHLRKPTADGQDTMDDRPHMNGVTTLERVQNREEFRNLVSDVGELPETQRSALLLREMDAMSYEEIAQAMDTTVPGIKSLLVRARIALAESSQARQLTCDDVRVTLAEVAEGLRKADGPVRRHVKACEGCRDFRSELRSNSKALAALFPAGPLLALKATLLGKLSGLFGGGATGAGGGAGAGAAGSATAASGAGATISSAAAAGGAAAASSSAGAVGVAIGAKAAATVATAALLTAGAVEVKKATDPSTPVMPAEPQVRLHPQSHPAPAAPPAPANLPDSPPATPANDVTVQPVPVEDQTPPPTTPDDQATTHVRKSGAIANADGTQGGVSAIGGSSSSGGVATGGTTSATPACDAGAPGAAIPGADPSCSPPASSAPAPAATTDPTSP